MFLQGSEMTDNYGSCRGSGGKKAVELAGPSGGLETSSV